MSSLTEDRDHCEQQIRKLTHAMLAAKKTDISESELNRLVGEQSAQIESTLEQLAAVQLELRGEAGRAAELQAELVAAESRYVESEDGRRRVVDEHASLVAQKRALTAQMAQLQDQRDRAQATVGSLSKEVMTLKAKLRDGSFLSSPEH